MTALCCVPLECVSGAASPPSQTGTAPAAARYIINIIIIIIIITPHHHHHHHQPHRILVHALQHSNSMHRTRPLAVPVQQQSIKHNITTTIIRINHRNNNQRNTSSIDVRGSVAAPSHLLALLQNFFELHLAAPRLEPERICENERSSSSSNISNSSSSSTKMGLGR